jgi:spectinomycin phosphotransferase
MRAAPEDLDVGDVVGSLAEGWGVRAVGAAYVPVGGGSHHWRAFDADGDRHWVTADDLDRKGFLGATREDAFDGLRRALDAALALHQSGLEFVVAPVPATGADTVRRLGDGYAVALFPFVDGPSRRFGEPLAPAEAAELADMLLRLHRATPAAAPVARRASLQPSERASLVDALRSVDREWTGGPFSEPARALVAHHAGAVRWLLETFDRLAAQVVATGAEPVVTHGEPHPGNVMSAGGRLLLVDWDTVALAPPERDLWWLAGPTGDGLERYEEGAGRPVDRTAIRLYRLRWWLDDLSQFLRLLRSRKYD